MVLNIKNMFDGKEVLDWIEGLLVKSDLNWSMIL